MKSLLSAVFLLWPLATGAYASDTYFKFGPGAFHSKGSKYFGLGLQRQYLWLADQLEAGIIADSHKDQGRKSSFYGSYSLGVDIQSGDFYVQSLWGVGILTPKDSYLGGPLQFTNDTGIGLRSLDGATIGVGYKHMSSAGIFKPNIGRDFLVFKMGIPF